MGFSARMEQCLCIVTLEDKVLHGATDELVKYLTPFIERETLQGIILNLNKVYFIDSSGVSILAYVYQQLQRRGASFALSSVRQSVSSVLRILQLERYVPIYKTDVEAIEQLLKAPKP